MFVLYKPNWANWHAPNVAANMARISPTGATREWSEETGLPPSRLITEAKRWVDDGNLGLGLRHLACRCDSADPSSGEPGLDKTMWKPPHEDPSDEDPVHWAIWYRLELVYANETALSATRVDQIGEAYNIAQEAASEEESPAALT